MPALGTMKCIEMCRHCTYVDIYVEDMLVKGEAPLAYGDWLLSIWLPYVADVLDPELTGNP